MSEPQLAWIHVSHSNYHAQPRAPPMATPASLMVVHPDIVLVDLVREREELVELDA
jgi:hypothetical protein